MSVLLWSMAILWCETAAMGEESSHQQCETKKKGEGEGGQKKKARDCSLLHAGTSTGSMGKISSACTGFGHSLRSYIWDVGQESF